MATIQNLSVSLTARTAKFDKAMQRSSLTTRAFSRGILAVNKRLLAFGGVLAGAATIKALVGIVRRNLAAVDATAKLADRIGVTTEALQGLRFAASQTGAGTALLDTSLDVLSKRLGEAAGGSGEAGKALSTLGLNVSDLLKMKPDKQFKLIADRIKGLATQQEKAAVTSQLFSRAGLKLLNTLELGSEGLDRMSAMARKLGFSFNRIDARRIENANDAIDRLQRAFQGVTTSITIGLAPFIEVAADKFTKLGTSGRGAADSIRIGMQDAAVMVAQLADGLSFVQGITNSIRGVLGVTQLAGAFALQGISRLTKGPGEAPSSLDFLGQGLLKTTKDAFSRAGKQFTSFGTGARSEAINRAIQAANRRAETAGLSTGGSGSGAERRHQETIGELRAMRNDMQNDRRL